MSREEITLHRTPNRKPERSRGGDGPNMILLVIVLAVLVGLLVGLGARTWTRSLLDHATTPHPGTHLSVEAVDLGYKAESDYRDDQGRAAAAVDDVLASAAGAQRIWENTETGNRGLVWASAESKRADGSSCRSLERRTLINGAYRNGAGVACRTRKGGWDSDVKWRAE